MKKHSPTNASAKKATPVDGAAQAWNRFWFTPADPTLLGLIRICCGLITLYTIAAYSFTLQDVFGKHAWLDQTFRDDLRYYNPVIYPPLSWDAAQTPPTPQTAEQQQYVDEYMQRWGGPPPLPFPRNAEEAQAFNDYRARWGIDPRLVYSMGSPVWSIWFHVTDPFTMAVIHAVITFIVFLFTIGFCTRLTSVLTWAAALCYIHRSPPTLFGVDTMMTILLLYLMIGPSGAALSVDRCVAGWWIRARPRVLARWRTFWHRPALPPETAPTTGMVLGPPAPSVSANFAIRLLQIHTCIIYAAAGLSKLQGLAWWNGTAVWGTLANFEFAPMQYESYMVPLRFLASDRLLWEAFMTGAGLFTLAFEITYVFLVWRPATRWVILSMAIMLHGFIGLFMGLKTFSLMMLVMNMAFLNAETVRLFLRPFTRGNSSAAVDRPPHAALPRPVLAAR
jgi:hypothetical protein